MASDLSDLRNAGKPEVLEKDKEGNFLVKNIRPETRALWLTLLQRCSQCGLEES
jgi:hypothetical protein